MWGTKFFRCNIIPLVFFFLRGRSLPKHMRDRVDFGCETENYKPQKYLNFVGTREKYTRKVSFFAITTQQAQWWSMNVGNTKAARFLLLHNGVGYFCFLCLHLHLCFQADSIRALCGSKNRKLTSYVRFTIGCRWCKLFATIFQKSYMREKET